MKPKSFRPDLSRERRSKTFLMVMTLMTIEKLMVLLIFQQLMNDEDPHI